MLIVLKMLKFIIFLCLGFSFRFLITWPIGYWLKRKFAEFFRNIYAAHKSKVLKNENGWHWNENCSHELFHTYWGWMLNKHRLASILNSLRRVIALIKEYWNEKKLPWSKVCRPADRRLTAASLITADSFDMVRVRCWCNECQVKNWSKQCIFWI